MLETITLIAINLIAVCKIFDTIINYKYVKFCKNVENFAIPTERKTHGQNKR